MLFKTLKKYLEKTSIESKFKVKIEENGGYITFSNSSDKYFTISLTSLKQMAEDILRHLTVFSKHSNYEEKKWRELSQEYYSDETIKSIAAVQTKPLFTTLKKIINWANNKEDSTEDITILNQTTAKSA